MEYIKVKDIFKIKKGKKVEQVEKTTNTIRYIQIDDLRNNDNIKYCDPGNKYVYASEKDIIIAWDGANAGTIGYGLNGAIGSTLAVLSKNTEKFDTEYCGLFLKSKFNYLRDKCTGATIPHISKSTLEDLEIPMLELSTQRDIAKLINLAQELIYKRKEQIETLDQLIKSVFYNMFGDIIKDNSCYLSIKECVDFIDYRGKTPIKEEYGVKLITAKNVGFGFYKEEPKEYISEDLYKISMTRGYPKGNDVLFATEGATLGYVTRIPKNYTKFAVGQRLITMVAKENITSEYLEKYMLTQQFQKEIEKKSTGSSAKGIRAAELKEIQIPVPNITLQIKFTEVINNIERTKELLQQSLLELEDNFNSLMQKAFKG